MAGEGELLLRETYSLERDLLPRPRTEDEVTPGEPMAKPKTEKKAAIAAPVSRYCRWIFSWATASSTSEASGGSATKTRRLADRRAFVDSPSSTRGLPAPRRRLSEWL